MATFFDHKRSGQKEHVGKTATKGVRGYDRK